MVRARDWARFQLAMEFYSVDVYCSLYWLIVGLFAFFSSGGWRSATFDDICDFPLAIRRALIVAPTILVRHASHDNLPQLCALASPTAAPELRNSIVYLQRLWKLESPSVSSILRLLRALGWLLIVAGDVELNPGPVTPGETVYSFYLIAMMIIEIGYKCTCDSQNCITRSYCNPWQTEHIEHRACMLLEIHVIEDIASCYEVLLTIVRMCTSLQQLTDQANRGAPLNGVLKQCAQLLLKRFAAQLSSMCHVIISSVCSYISVGNSSPFMRGLASYVLSSGLQK